MPGSSGWGHSVKTIARSEKDCCVGSDAWQRGRVRSRWAGGQQMECADVMTGLFFYIFSAIAIAGALGVVVNKNPVLAAFCLIAAFFGLAALFLLLNAYLVGIMQILICGGAVTVLFLFVIMVMKLGCEERRKFGRGAVASGVLVAGIFMVQLVRVLGDYNPGSKRLEALPADAPSDVGQIGKLMFTEYYFPLQMVGALLLIATVGVVVLSKRELKSRSE